MTQDIHCDPLYTRLRRRDGVYGEAPPDKASESRSLAMLFWAPPVDPLTTTRLTR